MTLRAADLPAVSEPVRDSVGAEAFQSRIRRLSLRANFAWTFVGNSVYAGCQWGMLVVLAKLGSPIMVGQFALALAVTAPVMMLTNLQLRSVQATDAKREYAFADYLGLRLISTALALLAIAAISIVVGAGRGMTALILLVGLAKAFESVSDVVFGLLQQHERMDRIAISMVIKGTLSLAALGLAVYVTGSVLWGAAGLALSWTLVLAVYDARSSALVLRSRSRFDAMLRPRWDSGIMWRLTWLALPLGAVMVVISLGTNIPRYFIQHDLGSSNLGFFAAMAYLIVAGTTVVSALGQSANPRLSQLYAAGSRQTFRRLLLKLTVIVTILGVAGVLVAALAGGPILTLLYRPAYAHHADVFVWIMVAAAVFFVASILGYGMTAARYFRVQAPLSVLVVLVTLIGCAVLVPRDGLLGAAIAMLIASGVQATGNAVVLVYAMSRRATGHAT